MPVDRNCGAVLTALPAHQHNLHLIDHCVPPPPLPVRSRADAARKRVQTSRRKAPAVPPTDDMDQELDPETQNERNEAIVWVRRDEECASPTRIRSTSSEADRSPPPIVPRRPQPPPSRSSAKARSASLNRNVALRLASPPVVPPLHGCPNCWRVEEQRLHDLLFQQQQQQQNDFAEPDLMPWPLIPRPRSEVDLVSLERWPIGQDSPPGSPRPPSARLHQPPRADNEYVPEPSSLTKSTPLRHSPVLRSSTPDPAELSRSVGLRTLAVVDLPARNNRSSRPSTPLSLRRTLIKPRRTAMPPPTPTKDAELLTDVSRSGIFCKRCGGCRCASCRTVDRRICCRVGGGHHADDDECLDAGEGCRAHVLFGICFWPCLCLCWPGRGGIASCRRRSPEACRCPGDPV